MIDMITAPILRNATPMQVFLGNLATLVSNLIQYFIPRLLTMIQSEPMLLIPVGVIAVSGAIGIFGRLLSRD